ncbi:hypothetical protein EVA_06605 [gut metagenome]|uniref:Uncharacterized protein n=1 Tax=gut metagenome TaxID=749906 RepID=J9CYF5_9ZZZZ
MDTCHGVCSCINFLSLGQHIGFPIRKACSFRNPLLKHIGIEFLQTHIFNTHLLCHILQVNTVTGTKCGVTLTKHQEIIV